MIYCYSLRKSSDHFSELFLSPPVIDPVCHFVDWFHLLKPLQHGLVLLGYPVQFILSLFLIQTGGRRVSNSVIDSLTQVQRIFFNKHIITINLPSCHTFTTLSLNIHTYACVTCTDNFRCDKHIIAMNFGMVLTCGVGMCSCVALAPQCSLCVASSSTRSDCPCQSHLFVPFEAIYIYTIKKNRYKFPNYIYSDLLASFLA